MCATVWTILVNIFTHFLLLEGRCKSFEHMCPIDGFCLAKESVCDGILNCMDGSDETADLCKEMPCRSNVVEKIFTLFSSSDVDVELMFRCDYGACVPNQFKCNGFLDCYDGSDETSLLCSKQRCPSLKFRCAYGACVDKKDRCNGIVDCSDGSDETPELCQRLRRKCRQDYFRCQYGACIYHRKKCNGKADCADGSDESISTCGPDNVFSNLENVSTLPSFITTLSSITSLSSTYYLVGTASTTQLLTTTATYSLSSTVTTSVPLIPTTILHTPVQMTSQRNVANSSEDQSTEPTKQTLINPTNHGPQNNYFTSVATSVGADSNDSHQGMKYFFTSSTAAATTTDIILTLENVEIYCSSSNVIENVNFDVVSCGIDVEIMNVPEDFQRIHYHECESEDGVPMNTLALIDCWGNLSELFMCQDDAKWHPIKVEDANQPMTELCQMPNLNPKVCGKLARVRKGKGDFQWPFLIAIFGDNKFLCSGTLVASQWVLTSAHCVQGYNYKSFSGKKEFNDGNHSLNILHAIWKKGDRMPHVSDVYFSPNYSTPHLGTDLALLRLQQPLIFSENLVPICLDGHSLGTKRFTASMGATFLHINSSEGPEWILESKFLDEMCFDTKSGCRILHKNGDQFCTKPLRKSETEYGDPSGSPYLVNLGSEHDEKWTLVGVHSHPHYHVTSCETKSLFTSVFHLFGWMKSCVDKNLCD